MCFVNRGEFREKPEIFENHSVSSLYILPRNKRPAFLEPISPVLERSSFKEMTEESEQEVQMQCVLLVCIFCCSYILHGGGGGGTPDFK